MKPDVKEVAIFGMLGALMYASKIMMDLLPNIHLIGVFIVATTVVYRKKALYPLYIFVFVTGLFSGFATWWIAYLYIWTVLWVMAMLIPKNLPKKNAPVVYMSVCALHGMIYGILYAPVQALIFGLDFKASMTWIVAGLPWDVIHAVSNFICGLLIVPIITVLRQAEKLTRKP
ncbi:MAG: hypothetical protein IKM66_04845 [Clostridia bacterium]|nr:hypothetical protein [Clostridia bacterium]